MEINEFSMGLIYCRYGDQFPLQAWKRSFFVSCIDLFALKIEASAKQSKKLMKQTKIIIFSTLVVETGLYNKFVI